MPFCFRSRLCWLLPVALFAYVSTISGVDRTPHEPTDSLLKAYYLECKEHLSGDEALPMCDTLYRRAEAKGNRRMQAIALCLKVDYYYFRNNKEGIVEQVKRVQEFCRTHGKEELNYFYYFVWSSRLITYYIKREQYNIAVYETRRMLDEAQREQYAEGVGQCYRMLANLYLSQNNFRQAYDNFRRQIEVLLENDIRDINMPMQYASMAQCALELNMPDSAAMALRKADEISTTSNYQRFTVCKAHALYCLYTEDYAGAKQYVEEAEELFRDDPSMEGYRRGLWFLQREYFKAVKQYDRALDNAMRAQEVYGDISILRDIGDICFRKGDMLRSAEYYRRYVHLTDSIRNHDVRNATADFSSILEIDRLQGEKRELQMDIQQRRLRSNYLIIFGLCAIVLLAAIGLARLLRLNRRLKNSESLILAQNENLLAAGEQLREAKERAELASNMKSEFIRNMSHEVRTPLNSIVGFSQVLASHFRDDPSLDEYAAIIQSNSRNLLRMVDDVLDLSLLDRSDELPRPDFCEMNGCCQDCVARMQPEMGERVALIFEPSDVNPVVQTHVKRIEQVLLHLLHNAAKFTREGEVILSYTCLPEQRLMRFTVSDTGPGIPPEQHDQVFERFVKLDAFAQGTGLGLPVCRIIADRLGGSLRIDPEYRSGCRMIFEVPYPKNG